MLTTLMTLELLMMHPAPRLHEVSILCPWGSSVLTPEFNSSVFCYRSTRPCRESVLKVFVPFCEEMMLEEGAAGASLRDAELVPFRHEYPILRISAARPGDALPAFGEAQVIRAEDWELSQSYS